VLSASSENDRQLILEASGGLQGWRPLNLGGGSVMDSMEAVWHVVLLAFFEEESIASWSTRGGDLLRQDVGVGESGRKVCQE